jgi:hypothetical protein
VPHLIRFVGREDTLIGMSRGGTYLFINIDNYDNYFKGLCVRVCVFVCVCVYTFSVCQRHSHTLVCSLSVP